MDAALMLDAIDQAALTKGIECVCFSGGEPMLYPDLIIRGATRARERKLKVSIVTNGYWGKWQPRKLAAFFSEVRPTSVHFSTDSFHVPFADDATLGRAVAFTYAMGVYAHIVVIQMRAGQSAQEHWNALGPYKHLVPNFFFNVGRFGRATQFRTDDFYEPRQTLPARCQHDGTYGLGWSGILYPCCRFEAFYGALALGDLHKSRLAELLENPVMALVRLLESVGFSPLIDAAKRVDPGLPVDKFSFSCAVCNELFRSVPVVRKYAPLITHAELREAVRRYLQYVDERGILSAADWIEPDSRRATVRGGKPLVVS
jgi:hypothetical protein